jgi:hypothetical protein
MQDTAQLIAVILLASFGVERIGAGASFLLEPAAAADDGKGKRRRKVLLAALAGALTLFVVDYGHIRIVERLQPLQPVPVLDYWLTWLVVFAGADRVKEFLGGAAGSASASKEPKKEVPPIKIVVDDGITARVA